MRGYFYSKIGFMELVEPRPRFMVKDIPVDNDLILAPLDGISIHPFRLLVREFGSAMSYTEFINAIDAIHGRPHLEDHLYFSEAERPVVYQLLDNDPERLLQAALRLQERKPDMIDINIGCPARSVSNRGAGSGLLRTPEKIAQIFRLLTTHLSIPVSAKIRLGWDAGSKNYVAVARMIEDNGGALIAVHGRTRDQAYGGAADWDAIAEVKLAVTIPVIANGDVKTSADIARIKMHTGCDAVMIGRAALGNPWIFSRIDRKDVPVDEVRKVIKRHLMLMVAFYGAEMGLTFFRKHAIRYLTPYTVHREDRLKLVTCTLPVQFLEILDRLSLEQDLSPALPTEYQPDGR